MPDAAPLVLPTAPFQGCAACGTWARAAICPRCGWSKPAEPRQSGAVPILLDVVVSGSGVLSLAAVWCARLPWLEADATFRAALAIDGPVPAALPTWVETVVTAARSAVRDDLARVLPTAGSFPVAVSVRVHNQHSTLDLSGVDVPGLEIVPFDAAIAESGRALRDIEVVWDLSDVDVRVRAGHEGPRGTLTIARQVLVEEIVLLNDKKCLARVAVQRETAPGVALGVALPEARALDLRGLQDAPGAWEIGVRVAGRQQLVCQTLPADFTRTLPAYIADIFVHPGSVSLRFCLATRGVADLWQSMPTAEAVRTLGLPPFDKAVLAADPELFAAWVDASARPLAAWAQRTRGFWLRDLVVATPGSELFAASVNRAARERAPTGPDGAVTSPDADRVLLGSVSARPEFAALAKHVRPLLCELAGILVAHRKKHSDAVRLAEARLRGWENTKRQSKNPLLGMLVSDPGPAPEPAPAFEPLGITMAWLEDHLERDPTASHLVLVDFGGTRIDVSQLRETTPLLLCVPNAGSERVMSAPETEWEALTEEVYGPSLAALPDQLRKADDQPFLLFVSGGGLANPWLRDRVEAAFVAAGFPRAPMVNAADLVRAAKAARDRGLDSPAVTRFLAVHEQDGGVAGRFDVVDGLRTEASK